VHKELLRLPEAEFERALQLYEMELQGSWTSALRTSEKVIIVGTAAIVATLLLYFFLSQRREEGPAVPTVALAG